MKKILATLAISVASVGLTAPAAFADKPNSDPTMPYIYKDRGTTIGADYRCDTGFSFTASKVNGIRLTVANHDLETAVANFEAQSGFDLRAEAVDHAVADQAATTC